MLVSGSSSDLGLYQLAKQGFGSEDRLRDAAGMRDRDGTAVGGGRVWRGEQVDMCAGTLEKGMPTGSHFLLSGRIPQKAQSDDQFRR